MKIFLRTPEGQDIELADEPIFDQRISGQTTVQIEGILRSDFVKLFERGNKQNNFTFQTARHHASLAGATLFSHRHYPTLTTRGDLRIVEYDSLDQPIVVITYTNAIVSTHETYRDGLATYHQYAVMGEQVTLNSLNYLEEDGDMLINGSITVPIGQNYVDVTGLGLSDPPLRIYLTVHKPTGTSDMLYADVVKSTVTASGFRIELQANTIEADVHVDYLIIPTP